MKMTLSQFFGLMLVGGLSHTGLAQSSSPVAWPSGVEAKIDEAIAIKKSALKAMPTMRSPHGRAAAEFGRCMDTIAAGLAGKEELKPALVAAEGSDLKASIALWALDRKMRPQEYNRIAAAYVDFRYDQPEALAGGVPAPGDPPPPEPPHNRPRISRPPLTIKEEDRKEELRWVLEYSFFAPPAGFGFDMETWGETVADGLRRIGNEKSMQIMTTDLRMQAEFRPGEKDDQGIIGVGSGFLGVRDYRTPAAFSALASLWKYPVMCYYAKLSFKRSHSTGIDSLYDSMRRDEQKADCEAWDALARREWKTDDERALAAYIRSLPPLDLAEK